MKLFVTSPDQSAPRRAPCIPGLGRGSWASGSWEGNIARVPGTGTKQQQY